MYLIPIKRKKGTVYRVRVKCKDKMRTKTFRRKIDAHQWGLKIETLLKRDTRIDLTFQELSHEWFENHAKIKKAASSIKTNKQQLIELNHHLGYLKVQDICYQDIESLRNSLRKEKPRSNKTINEYLSLTRTILNYAREKGDIWVIPIRNKLFLQCPERSYQYWQKEEATSFLAFVENKYGEKSLIPILYQLALNTGMRWGEIVGLKWDCVQFSGQAHITVKRTFCKVSCQVKETTKTNKIRYIGMNSVLLVALKNAFKLKHPETELVFYNNEGMPLNIDNFNKRHFHKDIAESGVTPIRFHDLRHTYASLYMMAGGNIYDLQKILGHTDVKTTMRYSHLAKGHILTKANVLTVSSS